VKWSRKLAKAVGCESLNKASYRQQMDSKPDKFQRAYDNYIRAVEGNASSAKEIELLLARVARERAATVEQIGRKIGLLMGRRFQENQTDPEWLLLCSIKRDLSGLLTD
jgi:hypothetical protein